MMTKLLIASLFSLAAMSQVAFADGDADKGSKVFAKCKSCHDIEKGVSRVGPTLKGIVGRPVAAVEGFKYSDDMTAKGKEGAVWDEATLAIYLADPKAYVPKTKMAFPGLKKEEDLENVIAFLKANP